MMKMLRALLMPIKAWPAASRYPVWGPLCSVPKPQRRMTTAKVPVLLWHLPACILGLRSTPGPPRRTAVHRHHG